MNLPFGELTNEFLKDYFIFSANHEKFNQNNPFQKIIRFNIDLKQLFFKNLFFLFEFYFSNNKLSEIFQVEDLKSIVHVLSLTNFENLKKYRDIWTKNSEVQFEKDQEFTIFFRTFIDLFYNKTKHQSLFIWNLSSLNEFGITKRYDSNNIKIDEKFKFDKKINVSFSDFNSKLKTNELFYSKSIISKFYLFEQSKTYEKILKNKSNCSSQICKQASLFFNITFLIFILYQKVIENIKNRKFIVLFNKIDEDYEFSDKTNIKSKNIYSKQKLLNLLISNQSNFIRKINALIKDFFEINIVKNKKESNLNNEKDQVIKSKNKPIKLRDHSYKSLFNKIDRILITENNDFIEIDSSLLNDFKNWKEKEHFYLIIY